MKQIELEIIKIREIQNEVGKKYNIILPSSSRSSVIWPEISTQDKIEIDRSSVYVENVILLIMLKYKFIILLKY